MLQRTSGIKLPKDHPKCWGIISDLTKDVEKWDESLQILKFYEDCGDHYLIPRYYPVGEPVEDLLCEGDDIEIDHRISPRNERQRLAMEFLENNYRGVLRLEPGVGKTVIAIRTIATHKKRAIIIAHKDKLLDQWKEEILTHTTLAEEDIGRLTTKNYKECLKKKIILSTPHIFAIAVKNENKDFFAALETSNIGVMFVDECHVGVGPEKFSKASIHLNCFRTYGLSATPERNDGTGDIIKMHLGPVQYFEPDKTELLKPTVYMLYFPFGIYKRNSYFHWGGKFQLSRYYQQMYKSENYNRVVSKWIKKANKSGRTILVLGKNIKPLLHLAEKCEFDKETVGLFIPGAQDKKYRKQVESLTDTFDLMESFKTKDVVFSTYGACRDGNNREELDFLVMACPTTNPEQAIGRILRLLANKKNPVVVDLVDTEGPSVKCADGTSGSWFERSAKKRKLFYEKKGWEVIKYIVKVDKGDN